MEDSASWPDFITPILVPEGEEFAGRVDDIPNPHYTHQDGRYNVLVPKTWILENKERAIEILLETGGAPYIAFGGEATTAQDTDTVALSAAHRGAGMMIWLHGEDENLAPLLNDMYDMPASVTGNAAEDGDFPALTGVNHASSYMFGPLKEDTSKTCKIKESIDPNYMLDCQSCIGTATLAKAELGPADGGSEAGETKPTDSGEASEKIEPATDNTGNGEGSSEVLLDFGDDGGPCKTIRELLCKSPAADSYTTMCELWKNSETVNSNEGVSMTVFIPTDDAFATLSDLLDQAEVELDSEANEKILMFHATPGMVLSTHLDCTGTLEMFDGGSSRTKCGKANQVDYLIQKGSGNRKNDMEPIIIAADIMACDNSVIHIVSEVLLPTFIEDFGLN